MTGTNWRTQVDLRDWMGDKEKRLAHLERRRQITSPQDLLGPGFGPTATQVVDWNGDDASFNGTFWSPPGALNSPDLTQSWIGITATEDNSYGVQTVWVYRNADLSAVYTRQFSFAVSGRSYTPWLLVGGDTGEISTGVTALAAVSTVDSQALRLRNGIASLTIAFTLGTTIAVGANGDVTNTPLVQLPPSFTPASLRSQPLLSAGAGPVSSYDITSSGQIRLLATTPGTVLTAAVQLSVGGVYFL